MSFDPSVRDPKTWQMLAPGLWIDPAGEAHWFPDEVAAALDIPYTEETYSEIIECIAMMSRMILGEGLEMRLLQHTRKPDA